MSGADAGWWLAQDLCAQTESMARGELESQALIDHTLTAIAASQPVMAAAGDCAT